MAKLIKQVHRPHDCHGELKSELGDLDLWPGSVAECSCGKQFKLQDSQRDGLWWMEISETRPVSPPKPSEPPYQPIDYDD